MIPAPEAAVITNIGLEHTQELGGTLTLIAREKSGILKPGCRAVLYRQSDEVTQVIQSVCRQLDIPLRQTDPQELEVLSSGLEGQDFHYRGRGPYRLSCWAATSQAPGCRLDHPGGGGSRGLAAAQWPSWPAAPPRLHRGRRPQPPVRGRPCRRPASTPAGSSFSSPASWPIRTGIPCSAFSMISCLFVSSIQTTGLDGSYDLLIYIQNILHFCYRNSASAWGMHHSFTSHGLISFFHNVTDRTIGDVINNFQPYQLLRDSLHGPTGSPSGGVEQAIAQSCLHHL